MAVRLGARVVAVILIVLALTSSANTSEAARPDRGWHVPATRPS